MMAELKDGVSLSALQRKSRMWFGFMVLTVVWAALQASTAIAGNIALQNVDFSALPGDQIEIRLQFDGLPPAPQAYTIEQPARIALDLPGVSSNLSSRYHDIGSGNARSVTVVEAADRTRVVVSLTELTGYQTRIEGNSLFVLVGDAGSAAPAVAQTSSPESTMTTPTRASSRKGIDNIDFRRGADGEGKVIIALTDASLSADLTEQSGRIRVRFPKGAVSSELLRRLDVTDFATPVKFIDTRVEGGDPVVSVEAGGLFDYLAYQTDNLFVVDVRPLTPREAERIQEERFPFSGDKLSLNFQDIEVRSVLQLLADFTGLNMVASDTVGGRITLRLENVPWDQALELVLKTKGLDKRQVGNVMMVAPADEIAAREKLELENSKQIEELAPLKTEFIAVRYAKASAFASLLGGGQGLMSERGSVSVDDRTNTLLIQDTSEKLNEIRRALQILDVPVRQVQVEARIVVADSSFSDDIGVRWGLLGRKDGVSTKPFRNGDVTVGVGGSLTTVETLRGPGATAPTIGEDAGGLMVDLAATPRGGAASKFAVGIFRDSGLLELELSALQSAGRGEVVAQPKVITADRKKAVIESGTEVPYQEASSSGATSTSFKDAVLSLDVTPQITPDDRIIMDLMVNQDSVGDIFNGVPSIDTNSIQTQVIVENGETVVLGGVFSSIKRKDHVKTPFLGDLPYLGRLFRRDSEIDDKVELLIFITPRLLNEALVAR